MRTTQPAQQDPGSAGALLRALERLSSAALARDACAGDPVRVSETRHELHAANMAACVVIAAFRARMPQP